MRYLSNPATGRDKSINACAFAVLRLPSPLPLFNGYPTVQDLGCAIPKIAALLARASRSLKEDVLQFLDSGYTYGDIRAPLDIRRTGVYSPFWRPWQVTSADTSKQEGLVQALEDIDRMREHSKAPYLPILVDVNLYSRCMKLMYSTSYAGVNMRAWFRSHPVHFGMWHGYKQCVHAVYNAFLPFFVYMEYEDFRVHPETTSVGNFPKLITKECMVAAFFLHGKVLKARLHQGIKIAAKGDHPGARKVEMNLRALQSLLYEYVPALFIVGYLVRTCYWDSESPTSGDKAYVCMQYCYLILHSLGGPRSIYCYNMAMALLQWQDWHSSTGGACHVEEALEAMLSRLSRTMRSDVTVHTIDEINMLFGSLRTSHVHKSKDLSSTHLSATLCSRIKRDFGALYADILQGELPFIRHKPKGGSTTGTREWPESWRWPGGLEVTTSEVLVPSLRHAVSAVVQPSKVSTETMGRVIPMLSDLVSRSGIPPVTREETEEVLDMAATFTSSRKRKRDDGQRRVHQQEDLDSFTTHSVGVQVSFPCVCGHVQDVHHSVEEMENPYNEVDLDWEPEFDDYEM